MAAGTVVDVQPLAVALAPYISDIAQAIVVFIIVPWIAYLGHKWFNIQLTQNQIDTVASKASTWAGQIILAAPNNLKGEKIDFKDPRIAAAAASIVKDLPDNLKQLGWDHARVSKLVAGKLGELQPPPDPAPTTVVTADTAIVAPPPKALS